MVGRPVSLRIDREELEPGETLLDVHDLCVTGEDGVRRLDHISFQLHEGRSWAYAAWQAAGKRSCVKPLRGYSRCDAAAILMEGKRVDGLTPREIIRKGISMSFIPEDRLGMGLVGGMSITDNMLLKTYGDQQGPFLRRKPAKALAEKLIQRLQISTPSASIAVKKLSGGNVQKVLLGREIALNPKVLITAYPVRGLDIEAALHHL